MKKLSFTSWAGVVAMLFLAATANRLVADNASCGNKNIGGTGGQPCPPPTPCPCASPSPSPCPNPVAPYSVHGYTGNEFREVKDLEIWGGVGEHQLTWTRY